MLMRLSYGSGDGASTSGGRAAPREGRREGKRDEAREEGRDGSREGSRDGVCEAGNERELARLRARGLRLRLRLRLHGSSSRDAACDASAGTETTVMRPRARGVHAPEMAPAGSLLPLLPGDKGESARWRLPLPLVRCRPSRGLEAVEASGLEAGAGDHQEGSAALAPR